MSYSLKPDKLTNGAITGILQETWEAESNGQKYNVTPDDLRKIHKALTEYNNGSIFGEIAKELNFPPRDFGMVKSDSDLNTSGLAAFAEDKFENWRSDLKGSQVQQFEVPGFILYDGLYAKAGGYFKHIYRGRGMKIIWFKDGEIKVLFIDSTIDSDGLEFSFFEQDSFDIFNSRFNKLEGTRLWVYAGSEEFEIVDFEYEDFSDSYFWIEKLTKINIQFNKTYILEYLLTPPDVQRTAEFSKTLSAELWECTLDLAEEIIIKKTESIDLEFFKFLVKFLEMTRIEPEGYQITNFFDTILKNINKVNKNKLEEITNILKHEKPDYKRLVKLYEYIDKIPLGTEAANEYHEYILEVLQIVFSPFLRRPKKEQKINDGRKRIDIVFENSAYSGFFHELKLRHDIKCPYIFVECKNYRNDPENIEFDQLAGRLCNKRGEFGILVCRNIIKRENVINRCRDYVNERKHYIIVFDDIDVKNLIKLKLDRDDIGIDDYLRDKLKDLNF